jgi:hypothetical protein
VYHFPRETLDQVPEAFRLCFWSSAGRQIGYFHCHHCGDWGALKRDKHVKCKPPAAPADLEDAGGERPQPQQGDDSVLSAAGSLEAPMQDAAEQPLEAGPCDQYSIDGNRSLGVPADMHWGQQTGSDGEGVPRDAAAPAVPAHTGSRPASLGLACAAGTSDGARSSSAHAAELDDDGAASAREPAAPAPNAVASAAGAVPTSKARGRAQGPRRREYPVPDQWQLDIVLEHEEFGALEEDEEPEAGVRPSQAAPAAGCRSMHAFVSARDASMPSACRCSARRREGWPTGCEPSRG